MAKFAIVRHSKVKGSEHSDALNSHNDRTILTDNINSKLSYKNITLQENKYKNYDGFAAAKKEEIYKRNLERDPTEKKARFPRATKNKKTKEIQQAALSQEFIFTHSHKALSEKDSIEYLKKADEFLRQWFDKCEVLSSIIHLDEKTPHIHIDISYFDNEDKRFIQKELSQKGKTDIDKIRQAFQEYVANDFGLIKQDGSVVSKGTHQEKANIQIDKLKQELQDEKDENQLAKKELDVKFTEFAINHLGAARAKDGKQYTSEAVLDYANKNMDDIKDKSFKKTKRDPKEDEKILSIIQEHTETVKPRFKDEYTKFNNPSGFATKMLDYISNRYTWLNEQLAFAKNKIKELHSDVVKLGTENERLTTTHKELLSTNQKLEIRNTDLERIIDIYKEDFVRSPESIERIRKREEQKEKGFEFERPRQ